MLTLAPCPKWCRVCWWCLPHPALSPNSQQALRSQGACHPLIGKTCERDFCQRKSTTTIQCVRSYRELAEQIRHWQMKGFPRRLIPCHQQIQRQFYTKTMWMAVRRGRLVNWVELGDQPGWHCHGHVPFAPAAVQGRVKQAPLLFSQTNHHHQYTII